jgi:hypothetical protein
MRMGAFLMGGIVGVTLAMVMARGGRGAKMWSNLQSVPVMGMVGGAVQALGKTAMGAVGKRLRHGELPDLDHLKDMVTRDPELKRQINEILSEIDHGGDEIRSH